MTADTQWAKLRTDVLENIKSLLDSWNGSAEEAVTLISENEQNMYQLKKIEQQLSEDEAFQYTSVEKQLL
ncbi:MAG: flagellar cap protein, partial [Carnobacterium inhibens]